MNKDFSRFKIYRSLYRIRRVEEEIAKVYPTDKIQSPVHLSIGQESVSVGVCEALEKEDVVFGSYRSHALYLAKGGDLKKLICELYGKANGCSRGKGGSMHILDLSQGVMGTSGVVASTIPHAAGFAYALQLKSSRNIVVSFFGDGATEEGVFFEVINFAALKKLPILFVCENNDWAVHSRQSERQAVSNIAEKVSQFGVTVQSFDGRDIQKLFEATRKTVQDLRSGQGPNFFECQTSRWREHVGPHEDFKFGYRSRNEIEPWIETDPLKTLRQTLSEVEAAQIESEVEREIQEAFELAEKSPVPDGEELYTDVIRQ